MIETVKDFMENKSYFDLEDEDESSLSYATRDNGDVGEEEYGMEDYTHARKIKKALILQFGNHKVSVSIDTCDEWVYVQITVKEAE